MKSRLVVISHACVIDSNQSVYELLEADFDVTLVVPSKWRDELRHRPYAPQRSQQFRGNFVKVRTWGIGRPQRHFALLRYASFLRKQRANFVIIEEEPFSVSGNLWSRAARRCGVPYAVQVAENLSRPMPSVVQHARRRVLVGATFVLARSPEALQRARDWGYTGPESVVPHGVSSVSSTRTNRPVGVVGFVGRLIEAKGIDDLVQIMIQHPTLRLRVAGEGPGRAALETLGSRVEMLGTLASKSMSDFYDSVSVVVVPSRTTSTWSEQFGRVIVEAQARATPVVAYASGEIPWVAEHTAAILVNEGDTTLLGQRVFEIAEDPETALSIGLKGRDGVLANFTNQSVAAQLAALVKSNRVERQ